MGNFSWQCLFLVTTMLCWLFLDILNFAILMFFKVTIATGIAIRLYFLNHQDKFFLFICRQSTVTGINTLPKPRWVLWHSWRSLITDAFLIQLMRLWFVRLCRRSPGIWASVAFQRRNLTFAPFDPWYLTSCPIQLHRLGRIPLLIGNKCWKANWF